jgi:hypothetical protein
MSVVGQRGQSAHFRSARTKTHGKVLLAAEDLLAYTN